MIHQSALMAYGYANRETADIISAFLVVMRPLLDARIEDRSKLYVGTDGGAAVMRGVADAFPHDVVKGDTNNVSTWPPVCSVSQFVLTPSLSFIF